MAKLIHSAIASLDGYIEDEDGGLDWAAPEAEVHASGDETLVVPSEYLEVVAVRR